MNTTTKVSALFRALLLGAAAALAVPAYAANDAMMDLLKILRDKGSITAEEYEMLTAASTADAEHVEDAANQLKTLNKTLPKVTTEGKLEIAKQDGEFSWRIGGRAHLDAAFYDNDTGTDMTGGSRTTTFASGTEMRRARLDVTANAWKVWNFKLQYDFTDSGQAGFRDVYLRYLFKEPEKQQGWITVGKFKEPYSLDELTSSNDDPFMEQSLTEIFYPSRRVGIAGSTWGSDMWTATVGIFGEDTTVSGSQPSCGASINASDGVISTCTGNASEGWAVAGRVTVSPIHSKSGDRVAHFGFAANHRMPDDVDSISFSPRPETRIARDTLLQTGTIRRVDSVDRFGIEAAGNYGPASLQGEYFWVNVNRQSGAGSDLAFDGFYILGSWILTGESRPYKFEDGVFQNPKPNGVFGKGGMGAWELVARYSNLDLFDSDLSACANPDSSNQCGEEQNFTAGLNWYPTQNFKFMAQYVQVLDVEGGRFDGAEPSVFQLRSQFYW